MALRQAGKAFLFTSPPPRPTCARRPAETLTPAATSDLFPSPLPCSAAFPWPRSKLSDGGSRPLLVVAALGSANETRTVLRNLDKTTTKCHNEVKPGYYRADNVVLQQLQLNP